MLVKTRFAPSPTGFLHVGGLRTALFAYLLAKKNNGTFLLRIEDTDQARLMPGSMESMLNMLHWAGITIDEGVDVEQNKIIQKGELGPYIQSERLEIYQKYTAELIAKGHAYYCFCTKERLDEVRKFQELNKLPTGYDGHCRDIKSDEAKTRLKNNETSVIRLKMPREGVTMFTDLVRGQVEFKNSLIDDQVLMKSDGFPTYHLAVVVDDHLMKISHIIRGEEWLSSTPKHVILYQMFGWEAPHFVHLPLLVNCDKKKLSKRHDDVSVNDYKAKGYLPEALINFIAFLGWNPGTEREIFTFKELEQEFSLEKVSKNPAVFNLEKLDWFNQQYLRSLSREELVARAKQFLTAQFPDYANCNPRVKNELDIWLGDLFALEQERATTLVNLVTELGFIFKTPNPKIVVEMIVWKKSTPEETKKILQELVGLLTAISEESWTATEIDPCLRAWLESSGYGVGNVYWPMRVALSGQKNSPGPTEIAMVLGKKNTILRLSTAVENL